MTMLTSFLVRVACVVLEHVLCILHRRKLSAWVQKLGRSHPGGRLHWGGLKDFADGSLGSQTALMHQPYANDPSSRGVRLTAKETLQELVTAADMAGLQVIGCWVVSLYVASNIPDKAICC